MSIEKPRHRDALRVAEMREIVQHLMRSHIAWIGATDVIYAPMAGNMQPDWNDMVVANQVRRNNHEQTEILTNAIHKLVMMGDADRSRVSYWSKEGTVWRWVAKALAGGEFDRWVRVFREHVDSVDSLLVDRLDAIFQPAGVRLRVHEDARGKRDVWVRIHVRTTEGRAA